MRGPRMFQHWVLYIMVSLKCNDFQLFCHQIIQVEAFRNGISVTVITLQQVWDPELSEYDTEVERFCMYAFLKHSKTRVLSIISTSLVMFSQWASYPFLMF